MEAFAAAAGDLWRDIKDDTKEKAYCVLNVNPDKTLSLAGSGRCGMHRLTPFLTQTGIQFAAFRVFACENITHAGTHTGTHVHKQAKFVVVTWTGPEAPMKLKLAAASLKPFATKFFDGAHVDFECQSMDALTEEAIIARLQAGRGGGGSKPVTWQFGTGNVEDIEDHEVEAARLAAEEAAARAEAARLAEEERIRKRNMLPPRAKAEIKRTQTNPEIKGYDFSQLVDAAVVESLADADNPMAWAVFGVSEEEPKKVTVQGHGSGGLEDLIAALRDDDIQHGAFRVTAVDREGARLSLRARVIWFTWNGAAATSRAKFRNREVGGAVTKYFEGAALEMKLNGDKAEFETKAVMEKLKTILKGGDFKFGWYTLDQQADEYVAHLEATKAAAAGSAGGAAGAAAI